MVSFLWLSNEATIPTKANRAILRRRIELVVGWSPRNRAIERSLDAFSLVSESRLRVRQRPGNCSISLWRSSYSIPLALRTQFLDAVPVAIITPGPVVITAAFIGYLVGRLIGGTAAAIAVFVPPFLIVILAAPYYRQLAGNPPVKAFVQGVTAAALGAIAGAAVILGKRALVDLPTVLIAMATFTTLRWAKSVPEPIFILLAGLAGLALRRGFGHGI